MNFRQLHRRTRRKAEDSCPPPSKNLNFDYLGRFWSKAKQIVSASWKQTHKRLSRIIIVYLYDISRSELNNRPQVLASWLTPDNHVNKISFLYYQHIDICHQIDQFLKKIARLWLIRNIVKCYHQESVSFVILTYRYKSVYRHAISIWSVEFILTKNGRKCLSHNWQLFFKIDRTVIFSSWITCDVRRFTRQIILVGSKVSWRTMLKCKFPTN